MTFTLSMEFAHYVCGEKSPPQLHEQDFPIARRFASDCRYLIVSSASSLLRLRRSLSEWTARAARLTTQTDWGTLIQQLNNAASVSLGGNEMVPVSL